MRCCEASVTMERYLSLVICAGLSGGREDWCSGTVDVRCKWWVRGSERGRRTDVVLVSLVREQLEERVEL